MQQAQKSKHEITIPANFGSQSLSELQSQIEEIISSNVKEIDINCSELTRVVSAHVGALWLTYCRCDQAGIHMNVISPSEALLETLRAMNLLEFILPEYSETTTEPLMRIQEDGNDSLRFLAMEFQASEEEIDRALKSLEKFLHRLKVDPTSTAKILTVYYEVATNIREHSSLGSNNTIEFSADADSYGVTMQFVDLGDEFDPTLVDTSFDPEQAIREGKTRGFGLAMIKKLSDSISYLRQDDRQNVLTVAAKWRK